MTEMDDLIVKRSSISMHIGIHLGSRSRTFVNDSVLYLNVETLKNSAFAASRMNTISTSDPVVTALLHTHTVLHTHTDMQVFDLPANSAL